MESTFFKSTLGIITLVVLIVPVMVLAIKKLINLFKKHSEVKREHIKEMIAYYILMGSFLLFCVMVVMHSAANVEYNPWIWGFSFLNIVCAQVLVIFQMVSKYKKNEL